MVVEIPVVEAGAITFTCPLKSVNGENKDFYQLVPQQVAMKGALSTDAVEAPSEPPTPPVVENGRFTWFCFGDDLQEDDK